jgi:hypothetical protein
MDILKTRLIIVPVISVAFVAAGCSSDNDSGSNDNGPATSGQMAPQVQLQSEGRFNVCGADQDFSDSLLPM